MWADRDGARRISPLPPGSIEIGGERGAVRLSPHQSPNGCQGRRCIGIDVAKAWLDVATSGEERVWRVRNDSDGITTLVADLAARAPQLVVLEATGGHETAVTAALVAAGLAVAVVNPRQVRDFAKATGHLAKSDALDARVLARFAQRI